MHIIKGFFMGAISGVALTAVAILAIEQSGRLFLNVDRIEALVERSESLLYLISLVLGGLVKLLGMVSPKEVAGNSNNVTHGDASRVERGAVTSSAAYAFSAAVLFALGHIVASGVQGFVFSQLSIEQLSTSWLTSLLSPVYTSCMLLMAMVIPYLHFRSFAKECRDRGIIPSFHAALLIGPASILLIGISAFAGLSPNQFIILSLDDSLRMPLGIGISHFVYQAILRFGVFPFVALVACVSARRTYRQKQLV